MEDSMVRTHFNDGMYAYVKVAGSATAQPKE